MKGTEPRLRPCFFGIPPCHLVFFVLFVPDQAEPDVSPDVENDSRPDETFITTTTGEDTCFAARGASPVMSETGFQLIHPEPPSESS